MQAQQQQSIMLVCMLYMVEGLTGFGVHEYGLVSVLTGQSNICSCVFLNRIFLLLFINRYLGTEKCLKIIIIRIIVIFFFFSFFFF